jgi:hypothetical protein
VEVVHEPVGVAPEDVEVDVPDRFERGPSLAGQHSPGKLFEQVEIFGVRPSMLDKQGFQAGTEFGVATLHAELTKC